MAYLIETSSDVGAPQDAFKTLTEVNSALSTFIADLRLRLTTAAFTGEASDEYVDKKWEAYSKAIEEVKTLRLNTPITVYDFTVAVRDTSQRCDVCALFQGDVLG